MPSVLTTQGTPHETKYNIWNGGSTHLELHTERHDFTVLIFRKVLSDPTDGATGRGERLKLRNLHGDGVVSANLEHLVPSHEETSVVDASREVMIGWEFGSRVEEFRGDGRLFWLHEDLHVADATLLPLVFDHAVEFAATQEQAHVAFFACLCLRQRIRATGLFLHSIKLIGPDRKD